MWPVSRRGEASGQWREILEQLSWSEWASERASEQAVQCSLADFQKSLADGGRGSSGPAGEREEERKGGEKGLALQLQYLFRLQVPPPPPLLLVGGALTEAQRRPSARSDAHKRPQ